MGRPPAKPDEDKPADSRSPEIRRLQVKAMMATGAEEKDMAEFMGLSISRFRINFAVELKRGGNWMKNQIEWNVARKALQGDIRCMLAWLRQYGGWTEVSRREITGANGEPISFRSLDGPSLDQVIKALREAGDAGGGAGRNKAPLLTVGTDSIRDLDPIQGSSDEGLTE